MLGFNVFFKYRLGVVAGTASRLVHSIVPGIVAGVILSLLMMPQLSVAETDVQTNNKQGKEMTPLMPQLSCAKKARRIKKLDNKPKRRKYIKQCQAEREIRLKAENEAKKIAEGQKKQDEDKVFQDFLKKGKKRSEEKMEEEEE